MSRPKRANKLEIRLDQHRSAKVEMIGEVDFSHDSRMNPPSPSNSSTPGCQKSNVQVVKGSRVWLSLVEQLSTLQCLFSLLNVAHRGMGPATYMVTLILEGEICSRGEQGHQRVDMAPLE